MASFPAGLVPDERFGLSSRDPVRDPLWGHIYLVEGFHALLDTPAFQKLRWIMQLGPAHLVYPGATHTRSAHSLGVYHLSVRLLHALLSRGACLSSNAERIRSFFAAALLHDVGHFPFTHALKELPLEDHEALSASLILAEPLRSALGRSGCDPEFSAAIVNQELVSSDKELNFFRSLLSGVLDPDKLDYLNRDARYCGVPYGAQDIDFIFSRLSVAPEKGLVIDSRGISSIEALLFAKYLMYRSVYWHRDVRSATAMVKRALWMALESGEIANGDLYGLDDAGLFSLLSLKAPLASSLASSVRSGALYQSIHEEAFDEGMALHLELEQLPSRSVLEERLREKLSIKLNKVIEKQELVIDVPERISFESDLWIRDEGVPFAKSSTVFSFDTVSRFTRALRTIRVFVSPRLFHESVEALSTEKACLADFLS